MAKRTTPKISNSPFKLPEEMDLRRDTEPRSIRFDRETEAFLVSEAARLKVPFSTLIANIAKNYASWLREQRQRG